MTMVRTIGDIEIGWDFEHCFIRRLNITEYHSIALSTQRQTRFVNHVIISVNPFLDISIPWADRLEVVYECVSLS